MISDSTKRNAVQWLKTVAWFLYWPYYSVVGLVTGTIRESHAFGFMIFGFFVHYMIMFMIYIQHRLVPQEKASDPMSYLLIAAYVAGFSCELDFEETDSKNPKFRTMTIKSLFFLVILANFINQYRLGN